VKQPDRTAAQEAPRPRRYDEHRCHNGAFSHLLGGLEPLAREGAVPRVLDSAFGDLPLGAPLVFVNRGDEFVVPR
jgi:hypothetical protein